jgi:hypothetical protein
LLADVGLAAHGLGGELGHAIDALDLAARLEALALGSELELRRQRLASSREAA